MNVAEINFTTYAESVTEALDRTGARELLARQSAILLKPNLINKSPHPITVPAACTAAVIDYIRDCSDAEIVIGEGCGEPTYETDEVFEELGYCKMAAEKGVELIDLNRAPLRKLEKSRCTIFPEMYLPEIAFTHFLISIPVLKAHSLAVITGAMKNLIGLMPPKHYEGVHGSWKKAVVHGDMQGSIIELMHYRKPDLSLMDATVGMAEFHLGGAHCNPPVNKILASVDAQALDRRAAQLLGFDWKSIGHLAAEI